MKILHFNYSLISAKATRVYIYTHYWLFILEKKNYILIFLITLRCYSDYKYCIIETKQGE